MNENFGMMDQCYFTPKGEILQWINNLLQINITKIESLGAGHVYCQILDSMDGSEKPIVPMSKVKFNAKLEYEFLSNLKILQTSFVKFGLKKHIEVEKLAKCKYQDNLEMIQWMKRLFDTNGGAKVDYDPVARRNGTDINVAFANKVVQPKVLNSKGQLVTAEQQQYMKKQESLLNKENNAQQGVASSTIKQPVQTTQKRQSAPRENIQQQSSKPKKTSSQQNSNLLQQVQSQGALIENLEQQIVEKNNKLEKIKKILLKLNNSDSQKVEEISALLGMNSLMQASNMQQQQLIQQEQLLQQQQEQHQLAMQQQMQQEMEQMKIQQELQNAQQVQEEDLIGGDQDDDDIM